MQPAANPITEQILRLNSTCVDYIDTRSCRQKGGYYNKCIK